MNQRQAAVLVAVFSCSFAVPAAAETAFTPGELWQAWPEARFVATAAPCLRPAELEASLRALAARHEGRLKLEEVGRSFQDRPIHMLTLGRGPKKVLLWSQMHGDEPSATPALLDIADFLLARAEQPGAAAILEQLTLLMVPMLNPDGSEIYSRRNAQGIDVNRDALNLATPEGRLLKRLRDEHQPMLGFNLHDQNRRTAVGDTGVLATNAVLAVSGDAEGTLTPGRMRTQRACAAIAKALAPYVPGGMARYDETWSPRSFGDNVTGWGTPVVLIESGGLTADIDFPDLTRLNFVAILTVLHDLVRDDLAGHDPQIYEDLKRNQGDSWVDVVVRGGEVLQPGTATPYRADLAFNVERDDREVAGCPFHGTTRSWIFDLGDARFLGSGHDVDAAGGLLLAAFELAVHGFKARRWLDGEGLDRLARLGVGTVRWAVPRRRLAAAAEHARRLPGRPGLEPVALPASGAALAGREILTGPPSNPDAGTLGAVLEALGLEPSMESLHRLWPRAGRSSAPGLRPDRPASFLIVSPAGDESDLMQASVKSVWLDGIEARASER